MAMMSEAKANSRNTGKIFRQFVREPAPARFKLRKSEKRTVPLSLSFFLNRKYHNSGKANNNSRNMGWANLTFFSPGKG